MQINTIIGSFTLTEYQLQNWKPTSIWTKISYIDGVITGVSSEAPQQTDVNYLRNQLNNLPDTEPIDQIIRRFTFRRLWGSVLAGLSDSAKIKLPPYKSLIEDMWFYPNRNAIYPYFLGLIQAGIATQEDLAVVVAAFLEQGIDITTIQ